MTPTPLILSPALPPELLTSVVQHETYPTTLIICSSRTEFLSSLIDHVQNSPACPDDPDTPPAAATTLLAAPLYQVAVARHIRIAFVPTVSHLRAYLSVFSPTDSRIPPPPGMGKVRAKVEKHPLLLVYGFLGLHRDTSEWSAQGISATAAALVEAARRCGFGAVTVDPPRAKVRTGGDEGDGAGDDDGVGAVNVEEEPMLAEQVPVLSASVARAGGDLDDAAWTGRKVTLGRVLGRWFRYREGAWAREAMDDI